MKNPFKGELISDLCGEDIDAYDKDGKLIKARIRIGAPYFDKESDTWNIRSEIMDVDYAEGPYRGTSSFNAMAAAVDWIYGRMEVLKEKHGYKFYYPNTKDEYYIRKNAQPVVCGNGCYALLHCHRHNLKWPEFG